MIIKKQFKADTKEIERLEQENIRLLESEEHNLKYSKALDEIEKYRKINHYYLGSEDRWFSNKIQDIINKTKDGEQCR